MTRNSNILSSACRCVKKRKIHIDGNSYLLTTPYGTVSCRTVGAWDHAVRSEWATYYYQNLQLRTLVYIMSFYLQRVVISHHKPVML